jgi:penicillin-binding protein 1C
MNRKSGAVLFAALFFSFSVEASLPSYDEVKSRDESSEMILLDRSGQRIDSYRLNPKFRKAPWIKLEEVAPLAREILVKTEDQHFFEHEGVDWFAIGRSAIDLAKGSKSRGASTLTMQLVSLIDEDLARKGRRSVREKINQIEAAIELEKNWKKDEILEAYLNLVPLRGELIGIHSVARFLFQKDPSALDPVEAALIVAMLPSPNEAWNKISDRACVFLKHVYENESAKSEVLCADAKKRSVAFATPSNESDSIDRISEHYTRFFVDSLPNSKRKGGFVKTSFDLNLQQKVYEFAKESLLGISKQNVSEIAALVIDHQNGEVLSYLGNIQRFSKSEHVDGIQAKRQAGSTLKPFFYGLALQNKKFDLNSTLLDEPIQIQTSNGAFRPENYDHEFHGWVPFATALASSMNIPAIKVVQEVGVDESVALLKKIGIQNLKPGYIYGPSIALGTVDLSLYDLTHAYEKMAHQALDSGKSDFPLDRDVTQKITRILSSNPSRSLTFGMHSLLATPYFTAVKTGTSKDMRDNWCVGYSDRYTVGVWVGNFSGTPMQDVSGVSGAAPLWRKIMNHLHEKNPSRLPEAIAKIELPEATSEAKSVEKKNLLKILYPHEGAILAVDPEIPIERQKVLFKPSEKTEGYDWYLNDEKLAAVSEPYLWPLRLEKNNRGKMKLEIRNASGAVVDSIHFTVR